MTARLDDASSHTTTEWRRARRARKAAIGMSGATALVAVAAALADFGAMVGFGLTVGSGILACAVVVDVLRFRLPNAFVIGAGAIALTTAVAESRLGQSIVAAGIASAPLLIMHLVDRRSIGFGDVKFAAVAGALVGLAWAPAAMSIPLTALITAGVARAVLPDGARPFGPALFGGLVTAVAATSLVHSIGWMS